MVGKKEAVMAEGASARSVIIIGTRSFPACPYPIVEGEREALSEVNPLLLFWPASFSPHLSPSSGR